MKNQKKREMPKYLLGDLIALLYDEADKISTFPLQREVIVHHALKDLLNRRVSTRHPVALLR